MSSEDFERLRAAYDRLYADSMIAHRWFAKHFGESMNGRDFADKCPMADVALDELGRGAREMRERLERIAQHLKIPKVATTYQVMDRFYAARYGGEYRVPNEVGGHCNVDDHGKCGICGQRWDLSKATRVYPNRIHA